MLKHIWVNYNDLIVLPHWEPWFALGKYIIPSKIAELFTLVNYCNLHRSCDHL